MNGKDEYNRAVAEGADRWVPACGGTEVPFTVDGTRYLYVYNPAIGESGYLNLDTDVIEIPAFAN